MGTFPKNKGHVGRKKSQKRIKNVTLLSGTSELRTWSISLEFHNNEFMANRPSESQNRIQNLVEKIKVTSDTLQSF